MSQHSENKSCATITLADDGSVDAAWSIEKSAELYGVQHWSEGFFDIDAKGDVIAKVKINGKTVVVALPDIVKGMADRGINMPSVLRIENILEHRIQHLNQAFGQAIKAANYQAEYRGVFPIKVNQQCHVIEEIADFGNDYQHGFEAGSKAELIIALTQIKDKRSLIVCNGYKDSEFVELALFAQEMGFHCIFVLETVSELSIILQVSKRLAIEPSIGVRIKSTVVVDGHWNKDSGDRSIFGLSTSSLVEVIEQLKAQNKIHCLQLLHCHLGSQIPNIRNIRSGVLEACQFYAGLIKEGAPMGYLDLGGGLAVDYEGSHSSRSHSMNYQLEEYCSNIVETISECLNPLNIQHPTIITESGRATVAYSSLLLFNVLDVRDHTAKPVPEVLAEDSHEMIKHLMVVLHSVSVLNFQECYNDALYYRDEIRELFIRGQVSIRERSLAENICLAVLANIASLLPQVDRIPPDMANLPELLSDIYYGNFSLFQSLPDIWAIDQILPIMPIQRLNERPSRDAILADITCDSDGKISEFVDFIHFSDNVFAYMNKADVYVSTSLWEGFGNTIVEAMACGLPVVGFDCPGGARQLILDDSASKLIMNRSVNELVSGINSIVNINASRDENLNALKYRVDIIFNRYYELID